MLDKVLISQDLSCYGQVSLGVALPLLGASGFAPTVLPTAVLSTHTGGFGANSYLDLADEMLNIIHHWQQLDLKFTAIYLGYLGKRALSVWLNHYQTLAIPSTITLIDPVMGDNGRLYRGFDDDYVKEMQTLIKTATIVTPNFTEAAFLLNQPQLATSPPTIELAEKLARTLAEKYSIPTVVITGIDLAAEQIGLVCYEQEPDRSQSFVQPKLAGNFFGTGDLFASSLLAGVLAGLATPVACKLAMDFISQAIANTPENHDRRLGINYASSLDFLLNTLNKRRRVDAD